MAKEKERTRAKVSRTSRKFLILLKRFTVSVKLTEEMLSALDSVHKMGIMHCDLKSSNIMITSDFNVKITDFGLAKTLGSVGARASSL